MRIAREVAFDADEILALYDSVGWTSYTSDPDALMAGLAASTVLTARDPSGALLGLLRVISDDATIAYVQDLVVNPAAHRQGVGRDLMAAARRRYGHCRQFLLTTGADDPAGDFYRSVGLIEYPDQGMTGFGLDERRELGRRPEPVPPPTYAGGKVTSLGADRIAEAVSLWERTGLTRPWNDAVADARRALGQPNSDVLAVVEDDALVATALIGHDGHRAWAYYVAVEPARQGAGLGAVIMAACEQWAREHGMPKIMLMVRGDNTGVVDFYERIGYEVDDTLVLGKCWSS